MPESSPGGNQAPKEMSMEMRLLLAFLLMGAVMLVTQYFVPKSPPPVKNTAPAAQQTAVEKPAETPAETPAPAPTKPAARGRAAGPAAAATTEPPQPFYIIDTDLFRVSFSNQGATLHGWELKTYKGNDGKSLQLVNTTAGVFPFSIYLPGQDARSKELNWAWYKQIGDADGLGVTYEYSNGHISVHKQFRFEKKSYLAHVSTAVTIDGKPAAHQVEWRGGFGDLTIAISSSSQQALYFDLANNKLIEQRASTASKGPVDASGNFSFVGLADKYFAAVFLTEGSGAVQETTFENWARTPLEEKPQDFPGVAVSDGEVNRFRLFVGPKDLQLLKSVDPKLEQVVNFGSWIPGLEYVAKVLFLIVNWANVSFVHNFGWSIVLITVVLNMIMFPLKLTNMKSMRKMQALKPQIDAINAKYKSISLRDPKKAQQNQEVMDLYKKYGVNPMGGCFPMLLQLPFFIAFYKVFTVSVEMRGATWLWVTDLSQAEHLPIKILPIIMIVTQFLMQKMTPQANVDPNQQKMMYMMPLIFGFMFYQLPSGLVLYYLTSNLVNMGQQWFFNHTDTARAVALSVQPPKKKK
ncbi:MAG TPA: membrane protein insertase YidC [Verrucomicrobiae bacterium]|nr:membrane protein insertase YidC [Verrucomicrobiae bacterium]